MTRVTFLINEKNAKDFIDNGLFAYFPDDNFYSEANIGYNGVTVDNFQQFKTCYAHIGQHSACHVDYAAESREATPEEYKDLLAELIGQGYDDLEIMNVKKEDDSIQVIGYIDATPTWRAMLPVMLQARDNIKAQIESKPFHTPAQRESLKTIEDEFLRMADIADAYVAAQKEEKKGIREALLAENETNFKMGLLTNTEYLQKAKQIDQDYK